MNLPDPVFVYLQSQDLPRSVVLGGLGGLVASWEAIVDQVEQGFEGGLDDYLNAMDLRDLVASTWEVATDDQQLTYERQLAAADQRMRDLVVPIPHCLYGDIAAEAEGWTSESHWWYFGRPASAGERLMRELAGGDGPG